MAPNAKYREDDEGGSLASIASSVGGHVHVVLVGASVAFDAALGAPVGDADGRRVGRLVGFTVGANEVGVFVVASSSVKVAVGAVVVVVAATNGAQVVGTVVSTT